MVLAAFRNRLLALFNEQSGNFGIMTAILLPVSIGVVGLGLDVNAMVQNKRMLQNAVDSAALATATALANDPKTNDADGMAQSFVKSQIANTSSSALSSIANLTTTSSITTTNNANSGNDFEVQLNSSYTMAMNPLSSVLGWKTVTINATGKATSSTQSLQQGISLYLVLDRSGSMSFITDQRDYSQSSCQNYYDGNWNSYPDLAASSPCYINKITSLKIAVSTMADTLNKADITAKPNTTPHSKVVRVGAVAFNDQKFDEQAMDWGPQAAVTYVNNIPRIPTGGTNSIDALNTAFAALKSSNTAEKAAFYSNKISQFKRSIIFMTDGEMTGNSNTWDPNLDSQTRQICNNIKTDGIQIFSIAFMAPDNGKSLLQYCASSNTNYYQPQTMAGIVTAFGDIAKKAAAGLTRLTF